MVAERLWALAIRDELGKPFDDGCLADARFADEHRIVLLAAREHFHDALDLLGAADRRIELAFRGQLRQIPAEVIECGRLGLLLALGRRLRLCRAALLGLTTTLRHLRSEDAQRLGAGGVQIDARIGQHLRRNPFFFAEKTEQEVFSPNVAVVELASLAHGELEHFLGARGIRQIGAGRLTGFPFLDRLLDFLLDVVQLDAQVLEHRRGDALTFADQSEKNVLRPDVLVVEACRLFASHREHLSHSLGEVVAVHRSLTSGTRAAPPTYPTEPASSSSALRT